MMPSRFSFVVFSINSNINWIEFIYITDGTIDIIAFLFFSSTWTPSSEKIVIVYEVSVVVIIVLANYCWWYLQNNLILCDRMMQLNLLKHLWTLYRILLCSN